MIGTGKRQIKLLIAVITIFHLSIGIVHADTLSRYVAIGEDLDSMIEDLTTYTITFKDYDGQVLRQDHVRIGEDAQAPEEPIREGLTFERWSDDYSNVKKDLVIFAQYEEERNSKAYIIGMPDGTFQPEKYLTRAELVSLLDRFYGLEEEYPVNDVSRLFDIYSDVDVDSWYSGAVNRITRIGVVSGYEDGTFKPEQYVTKEELAQVVYNLFNVRPFYTPDLDSEFYGDIYKDIHERWSTNILRGMQIRGLLQDFKGERFNPASPISRGEAVLMLNRYLGYDSGYDGDYEVTFNDISADSKWRIPVALASSDKLIKSKFISDLELHGK